MEDNQPQDAPSGSADQGKVVMRKLPLGSRVRRRLFGDELAKDINLACARSLRNENIYLAVKWNFDFKKEVPMDGPIKWYRKDGDTWHGIQPSGKTAILTNKKNNKSEEELRGMKEVRSPRMRTNAPVPAQYRARRRLFLDALENAKECSSVENTLNKIMEETHKDKIKKWNFDFQKEEPLEGPIQWYRREPGKGWYAMVPVKEEEAESMAAEADRSNDLDDPAEPTVERIDDPVEPEGEDQIIQAEAPDVQVPDDVNDHDVEMMEQPMLIENQNTDEDIPNADIEDNLASMEIQNQETPRNDKAEIVPQVRKRKREVVNVNRAKKRINFF